QAEDGIRERNVTGVQTCALPISKDLVNAVPVPLFFGFEEMERTWVGDTLSSRFLGAGSSRRADGGYGGDGETSCRKHWARASHRSEERRVGEEGSARNGLWHSTA